MTEFTMPEQTLSGGEVSPGLPQFAESPFTRAAQYVRMSTEHQRYSTENQADAIAQYAARYNLRVVRSYIDKGKSGLRIEGRDALRQLIADAENGAADFSIILVYDVSRWGRFQDADESAYYEYVCRRAGLEVRYCAEQFENDGSIASTIVKTVKRAMAGEYSRELSAKVFAGQCRLVELGFRQGGPAGFGLRRRLIDQDRVPKDQLASGERKSLQTDRVLLEPGPDAEVATVRRIFRMFVEERLRAFEIAIVLNEERITTSTGNKWTSGSVHRLLTNEKYIGTAVFNRKSFKLKNKRVVNPPEMWIRAPGAWPALVDTETFLAAQAILAERARSLSDEEMLAHLRALYQARGALSALIIDDTRGMPASSVYRKRFGSLARAYTLLATAPIPGDRNGSPNETARRVHADVVAQMGAGIARAGGTVSFDRMTGMYSVNGEFTTSVIVAGCQRTPGGGLRWTLRPPPVAGPHLTTAVRMDPENAGPLDYYLLPGIDMATPRIRLAEENGLFLDTYRFATLDRLFRLCARTNLRFTQ
jgi:DNA invertase Pin-like site-specific DNA recombinase